MPPILGNTTTTGENPAGPLTGAELVRGVQSGDNVKMTTGDIAALGYNSPLTTKGDIVVRSAGADGRLPVGADGTLPLADSTQALGIRWHDVIGDLTTSLSSNSGSTQIGFVQAGTGAVHRTAESKAREVVSVADFGADPTGTADNTAAFQAAINEAQTGAKRLFIPNGTYLFTTAGTTFPLPGDNGTTYPGWHGSGDVDIAAETAVTMPTCLSIPDGMVIEGESRDGVILQGQYNINSGAVDTAQKILFKIGASLTSYSTVKFSNFTVRGWFIGGVGIGVVYRSTFADLKFTAVAIPWSGQASEGATEWRGITMESCYAGLVQGGRWLMRDRTNFNPVYIPPYPATDIFLVGWCDNTYWDRIEWSSGPVYDSRAHSIDTFFDTYFWKSANSAVYPTGRASVNAEGGFTGFGQYRGIVGFPTCVMSRYNRFSFGLHATRYITNNHPRSQFYVEQLSRSYIGDFYGENIGYADVGAGTVFGTTVTDPYHTGQPNGFGIWVNNGDVGNRYGNMGGINTAPGLTSGLSLLTENIGSHLTVVKSLNAQSGVDFYNGTSHPPGMTSQVLGAYEEGTWTPSDASGAGLTFTGTFTYTRIGRLVTIGMNIVFPTTASSATVTVGGLPFAPASPGSFGWAQAYTSSNLTASWTNGGSSTITMRSLAGANVANSQMSGQTTTGIFSYYV